MENKNVNHHLKWIVKSGFFVFLGLIISKVLSYFYRIVVARAYGPEVYGLFSLTIMIVGWIVAFSSLGLTEGLLRQVAIYRGQKNQENKINTIIKLSRKILFFSSILSAVVLYFASEFIAVKIFHNSSLILFLKFFSFTIPFNILANMYLSVIKGFEMIKWYSFIVNIFQNFTRVIILFLLVFMGLNVDSILYSYALSIFLMFLISYLVCKYKIAVLISKKNELAKKEDKTISDDLFKYSLPLLFNSILGLIFYWTDSFSIGYLKDVVQVGLYNVAVPIAGLMSIVPELFMQSFFPLITREYSKKNMATVHKLSSQIVKWILVLNIPIFILIFIFPGVIINLLFGSTYLGAEMSLKVMIIGGLMLFLYVPANNLLLSIGKSKIILYNTVIINILNILLNFLLIPIFGILGAAIATSFSIFLISIISSVQLYRYTKILPLKPVDLKIVISGVLALLFLFIVKKLVSLNLYTIFLLAFIFVLVYLLMLFLFKTFNDEDLLIINSIKNKFFNIKNGKK